MRKLISSGSPFEPKIGFSRAVRVGPFIAVSGTAPEVFGEIRPASTFVEVKGLIDKAWLVEIEADCMADADPR
jgi:enamine deaminase RidA (YjgF/YER057c/UK114 family)